MKRKEKTTYSYSSSKASYEQSRIVRRKRVAQSKTKEREQERKEANKFVHSDPCTSETKEKTQEKANLSFL
jgi:hypothetical protein